MYIIKLYLHMGCYKKAIMIDQKVVRVDEKKNNKVVWPKIKKNVN